ncbi:MAG: RHS repeat-associated core domain-containing protein [Acidimicrobiales bacterium]
MQAEVTAGATMVYERDDQGTIVAERTPAAGDFYEITDGLGSVVALVDPAGTQRAAYGYDPYGGHATATAINGTLFPNAWRYAGGELDPTGLYHFGSRYYDRATGRWTQQDSVVPRRPGHANRYAYAGDDPANFVDPSGRDDIFGPVLDAVNLYKVAKKALKGKHQQGKDHLGDVVGTGTGIIVTTGCEAASAAATAELAGTGGVAAAGACATFGGRAGARARDAIDEANK